LPRLAKSSKNAPQGAWQGCLTVIKKRRKEATLEKGIFQC